MLLPTVIATVAWVAPFAAALTLLEGRAALSSAQIAELLAAAACQTRRSFTVKDFKLWTPVSGNANETTLSFRYTDTGEPAPINTACHLNSTSKSLTAGSGHTPRYACENRRVNFIWQKNSELVPIEEASCSDQSGCVIPAARAASCSRTGTGSANTPAAPSASRARASCARTPPGPAARQAAAPVGAAGRAAWPPTSRPPARRGSRTAWYATTRTILCRTVPRGREGWYNVYR